MNHGASFVSSRRHGSLSVSLLAAVVSLTIGLAGCTSDRFANRPPAWGDTLRSAAEPVASTLPHQPEAQIEPEPDGAAERPSAEFFKPGNDILVKKVKRIAAARDQADGDVKLNFQNANLLEVIKIILGDTLQVNYTVDPAVQGSVTMQTTQPLARADLIPALELLLRMNGAALIETGNGAYRVVPLANALAEVRAPQLGDSSIALPSGFGVRVIPLRYVAAEEMAQILTPFISGNNQLLRVDSARNLLVLASAGASMDRLLETIEVFDVDRMAGMSVALFTPDFVDAKTLAEDLEKLLADPEYGLMPGLVRFIVVERINGLMAVTSRAEHLAKVREWIQRLDRNTGDSAPRLFIYRVQNGKAVDLANVLSGLFQGDRADTDQVALAPGLKPATIGGTAAQPDTEGGIGQTATQPSQATSFSGTLGGDGLSFNRTQKVQIIADESNNALLIYARGNEYRQILAALRQLDITPMQVLIEVTIAEVTLTDNLSFGVEWFFKNAFGSKTGIGTLDLGDLGIAPLAPGFSYALQGSDGIVNAVLNVLARESHLSIISSPSLLVLNNHEATIQVGDEVPITTQQQQATSTDSNILNSIEYRETGILLTVKPRINAGGLVIMEVQQEASQVPTANNVDPLTPRIRQRKMSSTVAVNSGDTIILGGLITDSRDTSEAGLPVLHKVPFLGALFGNKSDSQDRTELIVLITPRAISDSTAALQVTEDYRLRLQKLIPSRTEAPATDAQAAPAPAATPTSRPAPVPTSAPAPQPAARESSLAPVPGGGQQWVVQVGSFKDRERAQALVDQLGKAGLPTLSPEQVSVAGSTWYRVLVGPAPGRQQAEANLARVTDVTGLQGKLIAQP